MTNEPQKIELKHITTRVRPPRVITLINVNDPDWPHICNRVIERYSQLWGGSYNLIVPTDGKEIDDVFWQIMEIYDPDYVDRYIKTFKDIKLASPNEFETIKTKYVEDWLKKYPEQDRPSAEKMIEEMLDRDFNEIEKFEISLELKTELIKRLNPFHYEIETGIGYSRAEEGASHNEPSVLPAFNEQNEPKITDYDVSALIKPLQLYIRSYVGNSRAFLKNLADEKRPFGIPKKKPTINLSVEVVDENSLLVITDTINEKRHNIDLSPFWYTNFGLRRYTRPSKDFGEANVVIVGDDIRDFCLFYNLSKIQNEVYWIPKTVIDQMEQNGNYKWFISNQVSSIRRGLEESAHRNPQAALTSFSLTPQQLEELKVTLTNAELIRISENVGINWLVEVPLKVKEQIKNHLFVYEFGNANNSYIEQFIDKKSVNLLKTPKPTSFSELDVFESRWISEIDIRSDVFEDKINGYLLPKKSCFSSEIFEWTKHTVNDTSTIRFSNDCISFYCPTMGFISAGHTIDEILDRPRLRLLDEIKVLGLLFKDLGYEIKLSDKGRYTMSAINMLGSLKLLADELKSEPVVKTLDNFIDGRSGKERVDNKILGCNLNGRSYLNFSDLSSIFDDSKKAREKIDDYLQKGIFLRGAALQCENCREADWYDVKELDQSFVCHRCYEKQIYTERHWRGDGEELPFYYKLNEMIYQGYKNNMIVPVLALNQLSKLAEKSFIFLPEIELRKIGIEKQEKPEIEIDTVCIVDGEIYLGEAKVNSDVPEKLDLLNKITNDLGAYFVYSTLADNLSPAVDKAVSDLKWDKKTIFQIKENLLS